MVLYIQEVSLKDLRQQSLVEQLFMHNCLLSKTLDHLLFWESQVSNAFLRLTELNGKTDHNYMQAELCFWSYCQVFTGCGQYGRCCCRSWRPSHTHQQCIGQPTQQVSTSFSNIQLNTRISTGITHCFVLWPRGDRKGPFAHFLSWTPSCSQLLYVYRVC